MRYNPMTFSKFLSVMSAIMLVLLVACGPPTPPEVSVGKAQKPSAESNSLGSHNASAPTAPQIDLTQGKNTAYFLTQLANLSFLSQARPNETMTMVSSHNREVENEDANQFVKDPYLLDGKEWNVLFDQAGPGCVTRLWMSGNAKGQLRFYFDHEQTPRIDMSIADFFAGKLAEPNEFIFLNQSNTGGGNLSYFPFPYAGHLTILTTAGGNNFRYQVNNLEIEADDVVSFTHDFDTSTRQAIQNVHDYYGVNHLDQLMQRAEPSVENITLQPGKRQLVLNTAGPRAIQFLQIEMDPVNESTIFGLRMQMFWDNASQAQVDCAIGEFFAHSPIDSSFNSGFVGYFPPDMQLGKYVTTAHTFYSRLFMPFQSRGQIVLENATDETIRLTVKYLSTQLMDDDFMHLYVRNQKRQLLVGYTFPFFEFEGMGNYIGTSILSAVGEMEPMFFYLSGDEFFYVDGEAQPSWKGTGLDNYFNGDDYFGDTAYFYTPTHGLLGRYLQSGGISKAFRFHVLDAIPYNTSLLMLMEIGSNDSFPSLGLQEMVGASYSWTNYWYGKRATTTPPRGEQVYYYSISDEEETPDKDSPVKQHIDRFLLPRGEWYINIAPIGNLSNVQHFKQTVE